MDVQDNSSTAEEVIDRAISDLDLTPGKEPKYFRLGLLLFKKRFPGGVYFDELRDETTNARNLESAVRKLVFRLKEKLEPYGYTIRRRSIYEVVRIEKKK